VKLAIPKGSLERATIEMLSASTMDIRFNERSYRPYISDPEIYIKILRPQEIPTLVEQGFYDLGISGRDWINETGADVKELLDLQYGSVKIVIAGPATTGKSVNAIVEDFVKNGKRLRISTEYPNIASRYISSLPSYRKIFGKKMPKIYTPWWSVGENDMVSIFLSFGATEAKPPEEADLVVDVTETGTTLQENGLAILDDIMKSNAVLIANKNSINDVSKEEKILDILALLRGVVDAKNKLHIFVNVREENLQALIASLPSLKGPTVSRLSSEGWYAVNTVIDREQYLKLLPKLRKLAQGLVVHYPVAILPLEDIKVDKI
ncbi:MAG: ATP phosphoribosyltransferase, partial [Conexivisphaerales archaeon]